MSSQIIQEISWNLYAYSMGWVMENDEPRSALLSVHSLSNAIRHAQIQILENQEQHCGVQWPTLRQAHSSVDRHLHSLMHP